MAIAIIPARGGSKRLPRKNILPLKGRPMLSYSIAAAQECGLFESVIVSTEDEEIARIASAERAHVIERPKDIATDKAGGVEVCLHTLDMMVSEGKEVDVFCCIYATAVFISPIDLVESFDMLELSPKSDFVMGVSEYPIHPFKAMHENREGFLTPQWPNEIIKKSQEVPRFLASNGTFYWARTDAFRKTKSFYGAKLKGCEIPPERAIDIDTPADYERAKMIADTGL